MSRRPPHTIDTFFMYKCNPDQCSICLNVFEEGEPTFKSPVCTHMFHYRCMLGLVRSLKEGEPCKCPNCRTLMPPITDELHVGHYRAQLFHQRIARLKHHQATLATRRAAAARRKKRKKEEEAS